MGFKEDKPVSIDALVMAEARFGEGPRAQVETHPNARILEVIKGEKGKVKSVVIEGIGEVRC